MKKYLCGVTYEWELGETSDIVVHDTLEDIKKTKCWKSCGIVEVELLVDDKLDNYEDIVSHKWIEPKGPWNGIKDNMVEPIGD